MLLNFEDRSPVRKAVEIEIPAELISSEEKRVTVEFGRSARIPGFRPGKVPPGVVRSRFAKDIEEQVMNRLLSRTFSDALTEKGVTPVGEPRIEHIDPYIAGAPIKYKAEFEIKPQFELADYRGIEIDDPKIEVTEHDVESMVERLREQASAYRPETERGLQDGDFAVVEITTSGEGLEPETRQGHFKMGEETPLPELHAGLFGKMPGDTTSFDKAYGDEAQNEAWRGKTVHYEVALKEIRIQEKPEVNDDFAKSTGGWETVEAMREQITADIRQHREHEVQRLKRNQIGERLLELHAFDVPEALTEEELGKSLQNYARFLASQGVDLAQAEIDWNKMRDDFRPEAEKRARRALILEQIAKKENLIASDVEVDREIRRAATENNRDFAEVKHRLKHEGGYEELRLSLSQEKALDFVLRESKLRTRD